MTLTILGLDPGRDKCGVAVAAVPEALLDLPKALDLDRPSVLYHDIVSAELTLTEIAALILRFEVARLVLGNQTTSREWRSQIEAQFESLPVTLVDERNSTLEARERYWQLYPASGMARWIPQALRSISRPVDDIVAIILIERYLAQLGN
ncbi:MAG: pre-16S rRNA-processing nuclease YqgF [Elainellaceae cyanobacterium]